MWLYSSPLLMALVSVLTLLGLLWLTTGQNPIAVTVRALSILMRDHRTLPLLLGLAAVLLINTLETRFELLLSSRVTWDFTSQVASVGGNLLLWLQRLEWAPATHLLTFVYVYMFHLFGVVSVLVYAVARDWDSMKRLFYGLFINYLAALPFYLFLPVKEAWAGGTGVKFLIPTVYPLFEVQYRPLSGLDNCVPSLHTSLALTYALVAWRSGNRRLAGVVGTGAGLVMLSTLYLGVHWPLDLVAGVGLAVVASGIIPLPAFRTAPANQYQTNH